MANYNKIMLMGNMTRDPQLSYLPSSQTAVVEFGLAVNRKWTGKDGSKKEDTCFIDCRAFGKTAETINKYCNKGKPIFVEGRLTFDTWTAQDGSKHSKHRVTVETFQFIGGAPAAGGGYNSGNESSGYDSRAGGPAADESFGGGPQGGDDIPF